MPRQIRLSTEYRGVYFVELANRVQSFFIRYKRNGKSIEERAGRSNQGWNPEKADQLRTVKMSGIYKAGGEIQSKVQYNDQQHWTFSKIFSEYLRIRCELKGLENDVYRFKNYLEMEFADKTPEDVTHSDLKKFRHNLENKRLKPATVRHVLELLRRLANFASKKKLCPGLSFKIEMPRVENQKTERLSQDQLQKLLNVLDEEQDVQVRNLVRLALFTGMRRGELFNLNWCDVDFYKKTITVRSGKRGQNPKIPLNELAENVLIEHSQVESGSKFVFPGRYGKKRTDCKRPLLRIKLKAGLPDDFRILQGLRHVYASMLASSGNVELEKLQSLLTHKSPLMTQRYTHMVGEGKNNSCSMATEDANYNIDSAEKFETLSGTVNDHSAENTQQQAFPGENVLEYLEEDTLEEGKVEDHVAVAGTVIRVNSGALEVEQEDDFVEECTGTEIATNTEDYLSTHIDQVVEGEVCLQNENDLTESAGNAKKNKGIDLCEYLEPVHKETFSTENVFAEFFENNKNFTYKVKNESIEAGESIEEWAKAVEIEKAVVDFETVDTEKSIDALRHSEIESTKPNVEGLFEENTPEDLTFMKTEWLEEGIVCSENHTAETVCKQIVVKENEVNEIVQDSEKEKIVKAKDLSECHNLACGEESPVEKKVFKYDDTLKHESSSKINKSEPITKEKDAFQHQIHKQDLFAVIQKETDINEVQKSENSLDEDKVKNKSRPSIEELKNELKSLSQLINSVPRSGK